MNNIDLELFIGKLEEKTLSGEIEWYKENYSKRQFVERSTNYERLKDVYTNVNKRGEIVAVGCFERRKYYNEDDFVFDDVYFITITDSQKSGSVKFLEEEEFAKISQAQLGKLHRIIQLKTNKIAEKLDSWFD